MDAGCSVTGDVMISDTGITQGPQKTPFVFPSPGEQTTAVFSYPWTSGRANMLQTKKDVSKLTLDYGSQMAREGVARMEMTTKWFQDRKSGQVAAPHRMAYTTSFPDWALTVAEHTNPDQPHIKTRPGKSTIYSATEGVTVHYSNFSVQLRPLQAFRPAVVPRRDEYSFPKNFNRQLACQQRRFDNLCPYNFGVHLERCSHLRPFNQALLLISSRL